MSTEPTSPKKINLNLNSVLTIIIGAMLTFVWTSVVQTRDSVVRLEANQANLQHSMIDLMPRAEIELRFKNLETSLIELRARQQVIDLEVIKLRERDKKL